MILKILEDTCRFFSLLTFRSSTVYFYLDVVAVCPVAIGAVGEGGVVCGLRTGRNLVISRIAHGPPSAICSHVTVRFELLVFSPGWVDLVNSITSTAKLLLDFKAAFSW